MKKGKNLLLYTALLIFSVSFIWIGNRLTSKNATMFTGQIMQYTHKYIVRVDTVIETEVVELDFGGGENMTSTRISFLGTVLFGDRRGEAVRAVQTYDDIIARIPTPVQEGNWIYVYLDATSSTEYTAGELFRMNYIIILAAAFFLLLIVFGRLKGLATIIALGLSVLSIFLVFIPAILSGYNIYFWAILICLYTIIIMPFYVGGFNVKSVCSALGCIGGVTIAGVLSYIMNALMRITGAVDDETAYVAFIFPDNPLDLRAIVFAAMLIGALGATIDVSMSIATSLNEMNEQAEKTTFASLLNNGMNIGRDIMGAQTSTLFLAYIGGALSLTLLLVAYQNSVLEMLNLEMVIIELLQALIGGFTVLFTIPATALVCALLMKKRRGRHKPQVANYHIGH